MEQRRIDLTHYLLYACSKFIVASIAHINLYTLSKWNALYWRKDLVLTEDEEREVGHQQHIQFPTHRNIRKCLTASNLMLPNDHPPSTTIMDPNEN
jgi:hypothetical protein